MNLDPRQSGRDPDRVRQLLDAIAERVTRPHRIMEICGGQTHSILRHGLDQLLPPAITLIHGPGCPVCVTPPAAIDQARRIARRPGVLLASFGDMLRVPGNEGDLLGCRAEGGNLRMLYSPLDAVQLAREQPDQAVVFFAVGFETTAPAVATAVLQAARWGLNNFFVLVAHVRVPPAVDALLSAPANRIDGLLAAGHVCVIEGDGAYRALCARHRVPIVITGFEPADILLGVLRCIEQLEANQHSLQNAYAQAVQPEGNRAAQALVAEVFEPADQSWRGFGTLARGGMRLRAAYARFDAAQLWPDTAGQTPTPAPTNCRAAEVLQGRLSPSACPHFGVGCTPNRPLGAPMVSSEGACAAYFQYRSGGAQ
ncbi:MAG: hydrogenase formation protein HypD [Pseudomonadota bacterium]|nr:hydrogenase formation protein HypD [Pseudomonadota bacterium]